ncbi:MAG: 4Fe-4S binding protein [Candidatus Omnitrophota bacterium]|nr:4Fe-4S binding protein [Candidatus Omnitrophota bacterium]
MQVGRNFSNGVNILYEVAIKEDKCKGCELCIFFCPVKHLEVSQALNRKGITPAKIKKGTKCTGCGFCFLTCPDSCIEVYEK